jgi:hypothetical protein
MIAPLPPLCQHCGFPSTWHKQPRSNGWAVLPWCPRCDRSPTGSSRPVKGTRTFWPTADFPRSMVARMPIKPGPTPAAHCDICGTLGQTETHHFAPVALFGLDVAESWPTANLCGSCHALWHAKVWPGASK